MKVLIAIVLLPLSGCLEGDPNPETSGKIAMIGTSSGTSGTVPTEAPTSGRCSQPNSNALSLTFHNQTTNLTMNVVWVDFACTQQRYATLAPGNSFTTSSFVGHVWQMRDSGTNTLYKEFIAGQPGNFEVTYP